MTPRRFLPLALLGLLLAGPGCAIGTQKFGEVLDAEQISSIKIGVSTKQDVLDLFGPPTSFNRVGAWFGYGVSGPEGSDGAGAGAGAGAVAGAGAGAEGGGKPWGWPADDVFTYEYREDNETFFTTLLFTWFDREVINDRLMVFFDTKDVVKYLSFDKQTNAKRDDDDDDDDDGDD